MHFSKHQNPYFFHRPCTPAQCGHWLWKKGRQCVGDTHLWTLSWTHNTSELVQPVQRCCVQRTHFFQSNLTTTATSSQSFRFGLWCWSLSFSCLYMHLYLDLSIYTYLCVYVTAMCAYHAASFRKWNEAASHASLYSFWVSRLPGRVHSFRVTPVLRYIWNLTMYG